MPLSKELAKLAKDNNIPENVVDWLQAEDLTQVEPQLLLGQGATAILDLRGHRASFKSILRVADLPVSYNCCLAMALQQSWIGVAIVQF